MKIRVAGTVNDSIVDGPGLRFTVFTQGCPHHCEGCHNPQTHDFTAGKEIQTDEIIALFQRNPLLDGITLSGGEPFCQCEACLQLARAAHGCGLNVWAYSGYTYEELTRGNVEWAKFLGEVDVLVDGRFVLEKRSLECRFRGSTNQRLIDVRASKEQNCIVELD